jgi:hypothetical protein
MLIRPALVQRHPNASLRHMQVHSSSLGSHTICAQAHASLHGGGLWTGWPAGWLIVALRLCRNFYHVGLLCSLLECAPPPGRVAAGL